MKKMMANKKFLAIMLPIACFLLVLLIVLNVLAQDSLLGGVLNRYAGMGEAYVERVPGSENWDTDYYSVGGLSQEEVAQNAKDTTKSIAGEGMVLLKNNGLLPLKTSKTGSTDKKVTLLGRRSVDTVFGGTGSGSGDESQCTTLIDALNAAGFQTNGTVADMYRSNLSAVPVATTNMDNRAKTTYYIGEFPQSYYTTAIRSSFNDYGDAAIIVIGREGGEGMDFANNLKDTFKEGASAMTENAETANYTADQHQLELSKEERDMIEMAKTEFDNVIVLVNSANVFELGTLEEDNGIDAIVWMAYPGSRGCDALAEILNGTINPSGRTVDTWMTDMTANPTFPNTYSQAYTNVSSSNAIGTSYTVEYEEGIYVGYRYYETACAEMGAEGEAWYADNVVYPFGYGLSYTSFTQKMVGEPTVSDGQVSVTVSVTNEGEVAGKDVIQLYYSAPYTEGGIEKAEVVLAAYDKTDMLQPDETKEYTLSFAIEDMASYDYKTEKCYVLDAGDYEITLRKNAHELCAVNDCSWTYTQEEKVVYNASNPRQSEIEAQTGAAVNYSEEYKSELEVKAAVNHFDDLNARFVEYTEAVSGKATNFTRSNFERSFPTAPSGNDLVATDEIINDLKQYTPDYYNSSDQAPVTGAQNGLSVAGLRGVPYDDPMWDELLDQLSSKDMYKLIIGGNQGTIKLDSVGLPATKASDGPAGLKQYGGLGLSTTGNFNCCGALVAATWNTDLAEAYGEAVGMECLMASPVITGWYAPGLNIHRSPFGGRNFEYYSEDPLISGMTCAGTITGCASMGVECYMKHFVANDVEAFRTYNGPCTWVNEQALREIYMRAFEIAVKVPVTEIKYLEYTYDEDGNVTDATPATKTIRATTAIMSAFNRIGSTWIGGSSAALNDVLRGEWGFMGTVVTDYNASTHMNAEEGVLNGNDLMLANEMTIKSDIADPDNASTIKIMRQALKNILYSHANSNAVDGLALGDRTLYKMAPWQIVLIIIDVVLCLGVAAIVVFCVIHTLRSKRQKVAAAAEQDAAPSEKSDGANE